ncbi:MAG TPA: universal stress protein [Solirubrobacteraceae bacterium]
MFKNVLVGVDGRPGGRDAIALARRLSDPGARLTLAFVRSGEKAEDLADSEELLERERSAADLEAELLSVVSLSPGRGLHEQAEQQGADLLVVGSCSHGTFGRAMLGDDTRAALNGAPCAVAVAARDYAERHTAISNLGVAYNRSPESKTALALAQELAAPAKAKVHALEVISLPPVAYGGLMSPPIGEVINGMVKEANDRMKELADVDGRAVYGLAGEELARFGDELDLLVVGSRGYGPVRRLVSGSTSNYLERHARCSLLVLPRTDPGPASNPASSSGD